MSGESPVRMRTVAAHSGAAFEAGQLGHRNGAAPEGTQVVNAREDPDTVRRPADTLLLLGSGDVPGTFRTAGSRTRSRNVPNAGGLPFRATYEADLTRSCLGAATSKSRQFASWAKAAAPAVFWTSRMGL